MMSLAVIEFTPTGNSPCALLAALDWVFELLVGNEALDTLLDVLLTLDILREELALDDGELDGVGVPLSPLPQAVKNSDTTNPEKILFINSIPWCAG